MAETGEVSRDEVEAAAIAEATRVGPSEVDKGALVKRFLDRGTSRATLYRWVDAALASGQVAKRIKTKAKAAAKRRAKTDPEPAAAAARDAVALIPAPIKISEDLAPGAPQSAIPFIQRLQECLATADQLLKHARTPEGGVRNSRVLLAASEHVGRTLERAARIQDSLTQAAQVENFHRAIFAALKEESPQFAEKVLIRLRQLNAAWGLS
jgi:hypothetical protein